MPACRYGRHFGGGTCLITASSNSFTPAPVFAETRNTSSGATPSSSAVASTTFSICGKRKIDLVHRRNDPQVPLSARRANWKASAPGCLSCHLLTECRLRRRSTRAKLRTQNREWPGVSIRFITYLLAARFVFHPHRRHLDRDPPLALERHPIQILRLHRAHRHRARHLKQDGRRAWICRNQYAQ